LLRLSWTTELPMGHAMMTSIVCETERYVDIAGSSMRVLQRGRGEAVILAHGYLWDAEMWRSQIKELSRHFRVIAPDLWGHGGSGSLPKGTRDLRDIARHHLELIDRLGVSHFSIVGHSVGGMWGSELALVAPDRVRSVVLLNTSLQQEPGVARSRYFAMLDAIEAEHAIPAAILQEVVAMSFSPYVSSWAPELPWRLRSRLAQWEIDRLMDSVIPLGRMTFGRRETLAEFSGLSMPKLVMHGAQDIPRPVDEGRRMSKAFGCRLIELLGAGHMAPVELPEDVTRHLLEFLVKIHRTNDRAPAKASAGDGPRSSFDLG
jgi:pimeloyl-ACP methyl ester carboxylesterase